MLPNPVNPLRIVWSSSVVRQESGPGWSFDPLSFVIGLLVAFLLVALAYGFRAQMTRFWNRIKGKAKQLLQRLTANMASRYSVNAIEDAQTRHLFAALTSFDKIYVEPRLHAPLAPLSDGSERVSLSPLQATRACDRLAVIGCPGSGRTALLNHLLLLQATKLHASGEGTRVPVYIYLPVLANYLPKSDDELADSAEADSGENRETAPAERLVQTALGSMPRAVATGVTRWLRRQVVAGNALILLDGWDEVPVTDRPVVTSWIQELYAASPGNRLVVTAGERGYAPLVNAGFVPLRPAPWTDRQLTYLAQRWSEASPFKDDGREVSPPAISYILTPPTPLEASVELVIRLRGQSPANTPAGKMTQVLDLLVPPPETDEKGHVTWPPETGRRALGRLALTATEQGRLTLEREEIQSTVTAAMPRPRFYRDEEQEDGIVRQESEATRQEQEQRTLQIVDCCRALTATGAPIRSWDNQQYYFSHPLVAAHLAASYLATEATPVVDHADDTAWFYVLRFYVGGASAAPLINRLLSIPDDIFLSHLWRAAELLAASPPGEEPWRAGILARLAQLFLNARLPALLRERCLTALVNSQEAGVGLLFKQALSNPDVTLRAGAILGLGALRREQDLNLIHAALADANREVRLAAVRALEVLARKGNETALELIVTAMIEAEGQVQREAAEALAGLGAEGHAVLRDAARDDDLTIRRASVYGLTAVGEPWAREIVAKMQHGDDEWLVRNAAMDALAVMHAWDDTAASSVEVALPQAESEPWLINWASERGEGTGVGDAALATLIRALTEGDLATRHMALDTLARLGNPRTADVLRKTLRDPEPSVRDAALIALYEISRRHDMTIAMD